MPETHRYHEAVTVSRSPAISGADANTLANVTITHYNPNGTVAETTGDQTYRASYTYDYAQRRETMTTYGAATATTTWIYSPTRGWLERKEYHGGEGTDYTYTDAGRLETRTWERGVVTTYGHDNGGRLETVTYSNETNGHTTPNLAYTYDALGRFVSGQQNPSRIFAIVLASLAKMLTVRDMGVKFSSAFTKKSPAGRFKERRNSLPFVALVKKGVRRCSWKANGKSHPLISWALPWSWANAFRPSLCHKFCAIILNLTRMPFGARRYLVS